MAPTPADLVDGYEDGWPFPSPVGRFLDRIREGDVVTVAALVNELDPTTVGQWAAIGSTLLGRAGGNVAKVPKGQRAFAIFAVELARAEAQSETRMVAIITDHAMNPDAKDRWRAAAWILDHHRRAAPPRPDDDGDEDDIAELSTPVRDAPDD